MAQGVTLSRRRVLRLAGIGALAGVVGGVGASWLAGGLGSKRASVDLSGRFAQFPVADEPNADPAKVVWPPFVLRAGPDVQRLYEFQLVNGDLTKWMPCFCGCGEDGHKNNRDCYIREVKPDGSVVFDQMAPT